MKNGDDMNGVSTLDLILIQRHILGIQEIDNPYALISADINNDQKISTTDLVALRKLILGIYDQFPQNDSWRFIDKLYQFPIPSDPWVEALVEDYTIDMLTDHMGVDFIGAKIGDVNNSAKVNAREKSIDARSNEQVYFELIDRDVKKGDIVSITFSSEEEFSLSGLQLGLDLFGLNILDIEEGILSIDESKSFIVNEGLRIAYDHQSKDININNTGLFTLKIEAKYDGRLSEMISINEDHFIAEVYDVDLSSKNIVLNWLEGNTAAVFEVAQNTPNPWQNATSIGINVPTDGLVQFRVMDVNGRILLSEDKDFQKGFNVINIEMDQLSQGGVLFYEIQYKDSVIRKKMLAIK